MRRECSLPFLPVLAALVLANPAAAALDQSALSSASGFIGAYAGLQNGAGGPAGADAEQAYLGGEIGFFDPGASDPISTDRQQVRWAYASAPSGSRVVSDTVTFAVPFTFGDSFTLGVYVFANAGKRSSSGVAGSSTADIDFLSTLQWGGTRDVLVGGVSSPGYTIGAASGIDWVAAAVPTPAALSMTAVGLLLIGGRCRPRGPGNAVS